MILDPTERQLKDVTLPQLVECDDATFDVLVEILKAIRQLHTQSPKPAEHLLRCLYYCPVKGMKYDSGDEPAMEIHLGSKK